MLGRVTLTSARVCVPHLNNYVDLLQRRHGRGCIPAVRQAANSQRETGNFTSREGPKDQGGEISSIR